jgi:hypothetical protein
MAVGGTLMRDEHGPVTQYGFIADVAYRLFLGKDRKLAFGIKGGMNLFQGQFAELHPFRGQRPGVPTERDRQDRSAVRLRRDVLRRPVLPRPELAQVAAHRVFPDRFAPVRKRSGAAHALLPQRRLRVRPQPLCQAQAHFHGEGRGRRTVSIDLGANFLFYEKLWLGAFYRYTDAVGALVQYNITDAFTAGYSYDYTLSPLGDLQRWQPRVHARL